MREKNEIPPTGKINHQASSDSLKEREKIANLNQNFATIFHRKSDENKIYFWSFFLLSLRLSKFPLHLHLN